VAAFADFACGRGLKLDETDLALLRLLERNGRMTNKHLACAVGLSPAACHSRVRRLESAGVIQGYHAVLDWHLLGANFEAWAEIVLVCTERQDEFVQFLDCASSIVSAQQLAQSNVFLLHVVASSSECWRAFLDAAARERFALEVARFNLAIASVKPARNATRFRFHRVA
jgi:Lrp/AsnC family transcriptional regulator, leucine-responsive regulatory protein